VSNNCRRLGAQTCRGRLPYQRIFYVVNYLHEGIEPTSSWWKGETEKLNILPYPTTPPFTAATKSASGGGSVGGATTPMGCASWEDIAVDKEPQGHFWKAWLRNAMKNQVIQLYYVQMNIHTYRFCIKHSVCKKFLMQIEWNMLYVRKWTQIQSFCFSTHLFVDHGRVGSKARASAFPPGWLPIRW